MEKHAPLLSLISADIRYRRAIAVPVRAPGISGQIEFPRIRSARRPAVDRRRGGLETVIRMRRIDKLGRRIKVPIAPPISRVSEDAISDQGRPLGTDDLVVLPIVPEDCVGNFDAGNEISDAVVVVFDADAARPIRGFPVLDQGVVQECSVPYGIVVAFFISAQQNDARQVASGDQVIGDLDLFDRVFPGSEGSARNRKAVEDAVQDLVPVDENIIDAIVIAGRGAAAQYDRPLLNEVSLDGRVRNVIILGVLSHAAEDLDPTVTLGVLNIVVHNEKTIDSVSLGFGFVGGGDKDGRALVTPDRVVQNLQIGDDVVCRARPGRGGEDGSGVAVIGNQITPDGDVYDPVVGVGRGPYRGVDGDADTPVVDEAVLEDIDVIDDPVRTRSGDRDSRPSDGDRVSEKGHPFNPRHALFGESRDRNPGPFDIPDRESGDRDVGSHDPKTIVGRSLPTIEGDVRLAVVVDIAFDFQATLCQRRQPVGDGDGGALQRRIEGDRKGFQRGIGREHGFPERDSIRSRVVDQCVRT